MEYIFRSPLPKQKVIEKINAVRKENPKTVILWNKYLGIAESRVHNDQICLGYKPPHSGRNSFRPVFTGKIYKTLDGATEIKGKFGLPLIVKIFMTIWMSAASIPVIFMIISLYNGAEMFPLSKADKTTILFPLAGLGVLLFGKMLALKIIDVFENKIGINLVHTP